MRFVNVDVGVDVESSGAVSQSVGQSKSSPRVHGRGREASINGRPRDCGGGRAEVFG